MDKLYFLLLPCIVSTCYGAKRFTPVWTCDFQSDDCGLNSSTGLWQRFYYKTDYNVFFEADVASSGALNAYEASFVIPNKGVINSTSTTTAGSKTGRLSFRYTVFSTLASDKRTYLEIEPCRGGKGGHSTRFSSQAVDKKTWNSASVRFSCNRPEDLQITFLASGGYGRSVTVKVDSILLEMRLPSSRRKMLPTASIGPTTNTSLGVPTNLPPSEGDIVTFPRPLPSGPNIHISNIKLFTPLVAFFTLGGVGVLFAVIYKRRQQLAKAEDQTKANCISRFDGHRDGTHQTLHLPTYTSINASDATANHNNAMWPTSTKYHPSINAAASTTSSESRPPSDDDVVWKKMNGHCSAVDGFTSTTAAATGVICTTSSDYSQRGGDVMCSTSNGVCLSVDDDGTKNVDDKVRTTHSDKYCAKVNGPVWVTSDKPRPRANGVVRTSSSHKNRRKVDYDDIWTLSDKCSKNISDDSAPVWQWNRQHAVRPILVGAASHTKRNGALSVHFKLKESAI